MPPREQVLEKVLLRKVWEVDRVALGHVDNTRYILKHQNNDLVRSVVEVSIFFRNDEVADDLSLKLQGS